MNLLTPAPATVMAGTFLAMNRQPLELFKPSADSARPPVSIEKNVFQFWIWSFLWGTSEGFFFDILANLSGLGRQLNKSWFQIFLESKLNPATFEPFIGFLAYLETKIMAQKTILDKNINVTQEVIISDKTLASHNWAADTARELFMPSKTREVF